MADVLQWTDRAKKEYDKLLEYLYEEWGPEITKRVVNEINYTINRIQNAPEQFPVFLKNKRYAVVASPQTSIFFKIKPDAIEITSVFDNRQNPRKRKFNIFSLKLFLAQLQ